MSLLLLFRSLSLHQRHLISKPSNVIVTQCSVRSFANNLKPRLSPVKFQLERILTFGIASITPCQFQKRYFAKGKSKGQGGEKLTVAHITEDELSEVINVESFKKDMDRILENMKEEFVSNLSLRSSIGGLESISVELEGDTYHLSEVAQIIRKNPSLVIVNATSFPQAINSMKKAIADSGMNLNPQQDGTSLFIQIPKVTKEHREKLAHNAKAICEKAKTNLKETQNKYIKKTKSKDGVLSEDLIFNSQLKIREMTQNSVAQAEKLLKTKQSELLKPSN